MKKTSKCLHKTGRGFMARLGRVARAARAACALMGKNPRPAQHDRCPANGDPSAALATRASRTISGRGLLFFAHTGETIRAEKLLRAAGLDVQVKGPPPRLRATCDMVIVFALEDQSRVLASLRKAGIEPEQVVSAHGMLLEPISLYQVRRMGRWIMVRAGNMKITLDTQDGRIVNISGGGCPDVPWLAHCLCGLPLAKAPEPLSLGQTLCCYSLQKAYEELRRQCPCGT